MDEKLVEYLSHKYGLAFWESAQVVEIVNAAARGEDYTKLKTRNPLLGDLDDNTNAPHPAKQEKGSNRPLGRFVPPSASPRNER